MRNTGPIRQVELDAIFKRIAPLCVRPEGHSGRLIAVVTVSAPLLVRLRAAIAQNVPHKEITGVFHPGHNHLVCEKHNGTRQVEETIPRKNYAAWTPKPLSLNPISFSNSTLV